MRESLDDLYAFAAIAQDRSFTRAAAKLGVSQSALSQTMRVLEARLDLRLLMRTTRSVGLTEAGTRLLETIRPHLEGISAGVSEVAALRGKPAGRIRLTADENAVKNTLWPALDRFLALYPDISVEVTTDYGLTDIVAEQFDAGVRGGELVAKDMIAVRIGPDMRMIVVGSPGYLAAHALPMEPQDLTGHNCINLRLPTYGGLYAWEFERDGRELKVRVEGQLTFNSVSMIVRAAAAGHGLAYVPEAEVAASVAAGELVQVLGDWCQPYPGYHLYYPHRRQPTAAFALLVDTLRYRP